MAEGEHSIFNKPANAVWDRLLEAVGQPTSSPDHVEGKLPYDLPEHLVMTGVVVLMIAVIFISLSRLLRRENPGWFQQLMEILVEQLSGMLEGFIGPGAARRYLPFIGSFAIFIFLSNLTGQFFFLQPPTQDTNTTFALAIIAWLTYHVIGLRHHGFRYFKQFLGPGPPPWFLWPLIVPIELISHGVRAFSLGLRLAGNVFGEHVALGVVVGLVPFLVPLPLMGLGLFAAFIQTFIFIVLTTLYIAGAEADEH